MSKPEEAVLVPTGLIYDVVGVAVQIDERRVIDLGSCWLEYHKDREVGAAGLNIDEVVVQLVVNAVELNAGFAIVGRINPQGLQVGVMKALQLLHRLRKVERRTRANVIYMPLSVIVPSHSVFELILNVLFKCVEITTQVIP